MRCTPGMAPMGVCVCVALCPLAGLLGLSVQWKSARTWVLERVFQACL